MKQVLKFDFSNIKGDFFGGITAGIVALPLALAFGEQTELGAIAGLYGAIAIGVLAALFGGTPTQISGPTAPMTVVAAVIINDSIEYAGSLEMAMPLIIGTFFLAGVIEVLFGILGVGRYLRYIPYPVVSGFMSGIGVIIIITQIFPFFGLPAPTGGTVGTISHLNELVTNINLPSTLVALGTILIIYIFPKITKAVPSSLVGLVVVTSLVFFLLPQGSVPIINDSTANGVPTGLPDLKLNFFNVFTDFGHLMLVVEFAFTLAALGAIDSLLTSIVADNITKTKHNSNQELVGQGIGNIGAAILGGLPGAGATMRTVINANSGGKTKISGIIAGLFLLAILLGLGPLVGNIPNGVLAGILITVGIGIIDYKGFKHLRNIPNTDAVIMIVVLLLTVFVGLLEAVAIGMVMAALLFMKSISDVIDHKTESAPIRDFAREIPWKDEGDIIDRIGNKVYIKHLNGPLFFGFASRFGEMIKALPDIEVVIIRMDRVPYVDQSGLYALEEAIVDLKSQGIAVVFTGLSGQPKDMLYKIKLVPGLVSKEFCFLTFEEALQWLYDFLGTDGDLVQLGRESH
jgi:SulP family sulfate permease